MVSSPHTVATVECPARLSLAVATICCPVCTDTVTPPEQGQAQQAPSPIVQLLRAQQLCVLYPSPWPEFCSSFFTEGSSHASVTLSVSSPGMWEWEELLTCPQVPVESQRCLCQPFTATSYLSGIGHGKGCRVCGELTSLGLLGEAQTQFPSKRQTGWPCVEGLTPKAGRAPCASFPLGTVTRSFSPCSLLSPSTFCHLLPPFLGLTLGGKCLSLKKGQ